MSFFSYQQGLSQGNAEVIADRRRAAEAINSWESFSNRLQDKLQGAELGYAKAESGRIGFAHLFKVMEDEFRKIDPGHPLLNKDLQYKIFAEKASEKASELGFVYDAEALTVVGKK